MVHLKSLAWLLIVAGLSAGCAPTAPVPALHVTGTVQFDAPRQVQATFAEVANRATVSLIDTATNTTVATTVSDSQGRFSLFFGASFSPGSAPYVVEAVKGLANNTAGNDAARVRTFIQWVNGGHVTPTSAIPGSAIFIGRATTALCVIQSLRAGATPVDPASLMGSVTLGTPDDTVQPATDDSFTPGASGVSQQEYHTVYNYVATAVAQDADPLSAIIRTGAATYALSSAYPVISGFSPSRAAAGTLVTLLGLNFEEIAANNTVSFAGTATPGTVTAASSTSLTVRIPTGAITGDVRVNNFYGLGPPRSFEVIPPLPGSFTGS